MLFTCEFCIDTLAIMATGSMEIWLTSLWLMLTWSRLTDNDSYVAPRPNDYNKKMGVGLLTKDSSLKLENGLYAKPK